METNIAHNIIEKTELQHTRIELRNDGIIQFFYNDHVHFSMTEAKELENAVNEMTKEKTYRSLRIAGKYSSIDVDVMKYLSRGKGALFTLADAFVIHSLPQKILANFYARMQKPYVPTNFFYTIGEAENWLLSLNRQELEDIHQLNRKRII